MTHTWKEKTGKKKKFEDSFRERQFQKTNINIFRNVKEAIASMKQNSIKQYLECNKKFLKIRDCRNENRLKDEDRVIAQ